MLCIHVFACLVLYTTDRFVFLLKHIQSISICIVVLTGCKADCLLWRLNACYKQLQRKLNSTILVIYVSYMYATYVHIEL